MPAGLGSKGAIALDAIEMDRMLAGGARWAVEQGYGEAADLDHHRGARLHAGRRTDGRIRARASPSTRGNGHLGLGQPLSRSPESSRNLRCCCRRSFRARLGDVVVSIHCGSRGLGHQIGTDFLRDMAIAAPGIGIKLPDLELACAPIRSELGQRYLGAMRAGINCALANRQIITYLTRRRLCRNSSRDAYSPVLFDVSHNTCKEEEHEVDGATRRALRSPQRRNARLRRPVTLELPAAFEADGPAGLYRRQHGHALPRSGRHDGASRSTPSPPPATAPAAR